MKSIIKSTMHTSEDYKVILLPFYSNSACAKKSIARCCDDDGAIEPQRTMVIALSYHRVIAIASSLHRRKLDGAIVNYVALSRPPILNLGTIFSFTHESGAGARDIPLIVSPFWVTFYGRNLKRLKASMIIFLWSKCTKISTKTLEAPCKMSK